MTAEECELLSKLLEVIIEEEWSGKKNTSCSCHPVYIDCCPTCKAPRLIRKNPEKDFMSGYITGPHELDCSRMKLIERTRAVLTKFNEQITEDNRYDENGEERRIYIP